MDYKRSYIIPKLIVEHFKILVVNLDADIEDNCVHKVICKII